MGLANGRSGWDNPLIFRSFTFPVMMRSMGGLVAVAAMILVAVAVMVLMAVAAMIVVGSVTMSMFLRP